MIRNRLTLLTSESLKVKDDRGGNCILAAPLRRPKPAPAYRLREIDLPPEAQEAHPLVNNILAFHGPYDGCKKGNMSTKNLQSPLLKMTMPKKPSILKGMRAPREKTPTLRQARDAMAARLVKAREAIGIQQNQMADLLNASPQNQNKYEASTLRMPPDYLWKLEKRLGITASYLVTGSTVGMSSLRKKQLAEKP